MANCHEEAQALREYLAEARKLDATPKTGNPPPNVPRPGGNVECGPKLSKNGKLCHCFEHVNHVNMEKHVFLKFIFLPYCCIPLMISFLDMVGVETKPPSG